MATSRAPGPISALTRALATGALLLLATTTALSGASFTCTIEQAGSQSDPTNSSPIGFEVVFGETINTSTFTASDLNVSPSGLSVAAPTETGPMDGTTFNVAVYGMSSGQTVSLSMDAGMVDDVAGTDSNAASTSTDNSVSFDTDDPVPVLSSDTDPTNGSFVLTVDFGEPVAGFTAADISVANGTKGALSDDGGGVYTITITGSADPITVDIAAAAATDLAGNPSAAATQLSVVYDTIEPTPSLSADTDPTNDTFVLTVDFGEPVAGFTAADISVANGTKGALSDDGGGVYTITITGSADPITVDIAAAAATDLAGNPSTAATQLSVVYDTIEPTPSLSADTDPTNDTFVLTVDFGEPVTGFTAADINVANGTKGALSDDGGGVYTITITGSADPITVDIAAAAATDLAGNPSTAATQLSVTYDDVRPQVTVEQAATQKDPTKDLPISFTITFSEPIDVTTFHASDITLQDGAEIAEGPAEITAGTVFEIKVDNLGNNGDPAPSIAANRVTDPAGNGNLASTSDDNSVVYNHIRPDIDWDGIDTTTGGWEVSWRHADGDVGGPRTTSDIARITLYYITAGDAISHGEIPSANPSGQIEVSTITQDGSVLFADFDGIGKYYFEWEIEDTAGNIHSGGVEEKQEDGLFSAWPRPSGDTTVNGGTVTWTLYFEESDTITPPDTPVTDTATPTLDVTGFDGAADITFIDELGNVDTELDGLESVTEITRDEPTDPAWIISLPLPDDVDDRVVRLRVADTGTSLTTTEGSGGVLDNSQTDDAIGFIIDRTAPTVTRTGTAAITLNADSNLGAVAFGLIREDPVPANGKSAAISGLATTSVLDIAGMSVPATIAGWNADNATIVSSDATTTTLDLSPVIGANTEMDFLISFQATDEADNVSTVPTSAEVVSVRYDAVLPDIARSASFPGHNTFQDASLTSATIVFAENVSFVSDGINAAQLIEDGTTAYPLDAIVAGSDSITLALPTLNAGSTYELQLEDGRFADAVGNRNTDSTVLRFYTDRDGPEITGSLVVTAGGTGTTIITSQLGATTDGNAPSAVIFELISPPTIGGLSLDGGSSKYVVGDQWSLADIQAENLDFVKELTEGGSTQFQVAVGTGSGTLFVPSDSAWVGLSLSGINTVPSLDLPTGVTYDAEAAIPIHPLETATLTDPENLDGGTLSLTLSPSDADDRLDVKSLGPITVIGSTITYDDGIAPPLTVGQILDRGTALSIASLQGNDTVIAALLAAITYDHAEPASLLTDNEGRTVTVAVSDGDGGDASGSFALFTDAIDHLPSAPRMTDYGTTLSLPTGVTLDVALTADNPEHGQTLRFQVDETSLPAGLTAAVVDDDVLRLTVAPTASGSLPFTLRVTDRDHDWSTIIGTGEFGIGTITVTTIDTAGTAPVLKGDPPLTLPATGSVTYRIDMANRGLNPHDYAVSLIGIPPPGLNVATSNGQNAFFLLWNASSGTKAANDISYPCAIYAERTASDAFIIPLTLTIEGLPGGSG